MTPTQFWEDSFDQKPQNDNDRLACAMMGRYAEYRGKELIEALTKATCDLEACAILMDQKGMSTNWINERIKECDSLLKKAGVKEENNTMNIKKNKKKPIKAGDVFICWDHGSAYGDRFTVIDVCGELYLNWDKWDDPESACPIEDVDFSNMELLD